MELRRREDFGLSIAEYRKKAPAKPEIRFDELRSAVDDDVGLGFWFWRTNLGFVTVLPLPLATILWVYGFYRAVFSPDDSPE